MAGDDGDDNDDDIQSELVETALALRRDASVAAVRGFRLKLATGSFQVTTLATSPAGLAGSEAATRGSGPRGGEAGMAAG